MTPFFALLLLFLRTVELRHVQVALAASGVHQGSAVETQFVRDAGALAAGTEESDFRGRAPTNQLQSLRISGKEFDANPKRIPRGAKDGSSRKRDPHSPNSYRHPRPYGPDDYFTTPRSDRHTYRGVLGNSSSARGTVFVHNPLVPVTDGSYGAYAVMLLALVLFAAGIVGNLALMCIVWHNYYLKSAWNSILAGLAFWDFVVLFFCLPVVVFHELTAKRLLGDVSCRLVPYMEVTSLGVATFSLCALSIDRFHVATSPRSLQMPQVEPCQSILAKLSVIWVGSMVLAAPELLLWQLTQEAVTSSAIIQNGSLSSAPTGLQETQPGSSLAASFRGQTGVFLVDMCVRQPSLDLPENIYSLVMTYHEARMWWYFGCYFCLPLLFTLVCNLLTRHVLAQHAPQKQGSSKVTGGRTSSSSSSNSSSSTKKKQHMKREQRLTSTVTALAILYAMCNLPENACNITLAYVSIPISPATEALLALIGQFLLYVRCSATPVLLLCLCRSLGQAFVDCCCCCCEECLPDSASSSSSSASTTATTASTSPSSLSSPTSPSPSSLSPSSSKEEKLKIVSGTTPAIYYDRAKDSSVVAIGTPC